MKTKFFYLIALAAITLTACEQNEPAVTVDNIADTEITVNAGVEEATITPQNAPRKAPNATRSGMTTADLTDLGLFIENEANSKYTYTNLHFKKGDDGNFAVQGNIIPRWQNETQKITVWAYSPYNPTWDDVFVKQEVEVKTSQDVEEDIKASDWLWAKADVNPSATVQYGDIKYNNGALDITLEHILSKMTVNVRFGTEITDVSDVPARGLTLHNFNTRGTVILFDASVGSTPNTVAKIYAYKSASAPEGYNSSFEAILLPQKSKFKVEIVLGNARTFAWEADSEFSFAPGRNYTLNLIVGKDKVEIAQDGILAEDWHMGNGGSLETE